MPSGDNEATVPVQRKGDRHVAARGRTVQDIQRRRAAPCRNVSESTVLLELTTANSDSSRSVERGPKGCHRGLQRPPQLHEADVPARART